MSKFHLSLLIHAHQPVGNFGNVLEGAYQRSYLPFVELLQKHPSIRLGLHYSGFLLEWIGAHHPEFFTLLQGLVSCGQVELIGGGFYEPILIAIPPEDRTEQVVRLADFIESKFRTRPLGAWLAERVWEPQIPSSLAAAGVGYTLVDDSHFLGAGFESRHLFGYYIAEDLGATVKLIPGLQRLRYLIPFGTVEDNIAFLRSCAEKHAGGLAAMGDDNEKFGVWPETYRHCYEDGWLDRFFAALEAESDWLTLVPPGEYLNAHPPLGRADLPAASYSEMMEWSLPTQVRQRYHAALAEFAPRPEIAAFMRGGIWRNFFSKYGESNLLHKKMLHVSGKIRQLTARTRRGLPLHRALDEARTHLLRAQCNDAYWHGVFGGVYAPHLRTELWRSLIRAERIADAAEQGRSIYAELHRGDFDADGHPELYVTTETCAALWKPADGATLAALDFRPCDATLINSMQRRPEPYHAKLREAASATSEVSHGAVSIHNQLKVKEAGLEKLIRYDAFAHHGFRLLLFSPSKAFGEFAAVNLDPSEAFAAGEWNVSSATPEHIVFEREALLFPPPLNRLDGDAKVSGTEIPQTPRLRAIKSITLVRAEDAFELRCDLKIDAPSPPPEVHAGLDLVINFLAPRENDRYFAAGDERHLLAWAGEVETARLNIVDEWQNVAVTMETAAPSRFWVAPIETVSESEEGFERVYQGSQIMPVWPVEFDISGAWQQSLTVRVEKFR